MFLPPYYELRLYYRIHLWLRILYSVLQLHHQYHTAMKTLKIDSLQEKSHFQNSWNEYQMERDELQSKSFGIE